MFQIRTESLGQRLPQVTRQGGCVPAAKRGERPAARDGSTAAVQTLARDAAGPAAR